MRDSRKHILMLSHRPLFSGSIGGVELHAEETIRHLEGPFTFSSLYPLNGEWIASVEQVSARSSTTSPPLHRLHNSRELLETIAPDIIHLQHPLGLPDNFIEAAEALKIPLILSVHDYALACPRYNLMGRNGSYCGLPSAHDEEHGRCLNHHGLGSISLEEWRHHAQKLLKAAAVTVFVSEDLRNRLASMFQLGFSVVIPCGISAQEKAPEVQPARAGRQRFKVCFLGAGREDKGTDLISALVPHLLESDMQVSFLGSDAWQWPALLPRREEIEFKGRYGAHEVVRRLSELSPDVVCLFSPWPETFSRTLSEAWHAGIPTVVSPFGAPAERVLTSGGGWVLPTYSVDAALTLLQRLADNPRESQSVRENIPKHAFPSSKEIAGMLTGVYSTFPPLHRKPRVRGTIRVSTLQSLFPVLPIKRRPPKQRWGVFVAMLFARYHEVGFWRTLERPLRKGMRRLSRAFA